MDPSTEQLIRDYLNRLAVAARSSMGTDELRAFIARMHDLIQRQCGDHGIASPADVGNVLAALGTPKALADRERARLAAARPDPGTARSPYTADHATDASFASPSPAAARRPAVTPSGPTAGAHPAAETRSLPGAPGTDGMAAGSSGGQQAVQRRPVTARRKPAEILTDKPAAPKAVARPRGPQGRDSPVLRPLTRNTARWQDPPAGTGSPRPVQPDAAEQSAAALVFVVEPPPDPQRKSRAVPKFHPVREPAAWPTSSNGRKRGPEQGPERAPEGGSERGPEQGPERGPEHGPERGPEHGPERGPERYPEQGPERGPQGAPEPSPADQPGDDGVPPPAAISLASRRVEWVASGLGLLLMRAAMLARRYPLETAAVIVLGLGGLIYPPVWLVGAVLALPSRLWDSKDKLTGLAAPAVLAIVGGAGLALTSSRTSGAAYVHGALVIGGYLIRAGSVLVAAYLAWRIHRGQRQPPPPSRRPPYQ